MRILLTTNEPSEHLRPLWTGLAELGNEVHVLFDREHGRFGDLESVAHPLVETTVLPERRGLVPTPASLAGLIDTWPDAVIVGGYAARSSRLALMTRRRRSQRRVLLVERPDPHRPWWRRAVRAARIRTTLSRVDAVWAMSEAGRRVYERLGAHVEALIPYPLPRYVLRFERNLPVRWDAGAGIRVLVAGQLVAGKRPLLAVAALRELQHRGALESATFAGEGNQRKAVEAAAANLPIRMVGQFPMMEMPELMGSHHVLLHPSRHDGWGLVVPEAIMAGMVVVATAGTDAAITLAPTVPTVRLADAEPTALATEIIDGHAMVRDLGVTVLTTAADSCESLLSGASLAPRAQELLAAPSLRLR